MSRMVHPSAAALVAGDDGPFAAATPDAAALPTDGGAADRAETIPADDDAADGDAADGDAADAGCGARGESAGAVAAGTTALCAPSGAAMMAMERSVARYNGFTAMVRVGSAGGHRRRARLDAGVLTFRCMARDRRCGSSDDWNDQGIADRAAVGRRYGAGSVTAAIAPSATKGVVIR